VEAAARRCSKLVVESGGRREWWFGPAAGGLKKGICGGAPTREKWRHGGVHREDESAAALRPNPVGSREL
jgi:hypothetical protein